MTDAGDVPRPVGHGAVSRQRLAGGLRPADPHRHHQHGDGRGAVVVRGAEVEGVRGQKNMLLVGMSLFERQTYWVSRVIRAINRIDVG